MNVGDVVGSYRITRVIGEGGMGVVYLATHTLIGREAAIKVLLPSLSNKQEVVQRFFNEAKTTTSIKHPGIVEVYDFGYSEQGHAYIVMEHLEGETLDARIQRLGNMPATAALPMLAQVARALGAAHEIGVVHRDLKPENIYIVSDPEVAGGERTKILDFGIAKLRNASNTGVRTASGQVMGPPGYMAPEQCLGAPEVDPRADIYALGCILFDMLCGRPPFESANFADVLAAHVSKEPPVPSSLVSSISPVVDALVAELLQKAPESRPQSVSAVLERIDAALGKLAAPRPKPRTSAPPPIPAAARKKRPSDGDIPPELLDSRAPLPPLPRPAGGGDAPRQRPARTSAPPPVPRAGANARTMYQSQTTSGPPGAPRPPLKDPALAATGRPPPLKDPALAATGRAPPLKDPALAATGRAPPPKDPALAATMASPSMPPQPMPPQPMPPHAGPGPSGTVPPQQQPPLQQQPAPQQQGPAPIAFGDPAQAQRPVQMGPGPAARGDVFGPPGAVPQRRGAGLLLPIVLILIVGAAGGGFFLYRQMGSEASATGSADAGVVAVSDPPADAAATPADPDAAATAAAIDAAPAPVADAATATAAADAALAPGADAGGTAVAEAGSGKVLDPALDPDKKDVETVTIVINSRPPGADVIRTHDNLELGKTPLEYVTKKFNANEEFLVQMPGHYPVKTKVSTNRDGARQVVLLARPD